MKIYARLENNIVVELAEFDSIEGRFHPSLIFVEATSETKLFDIYEGGVFIRPVPTEVEVSYRELRAQEYPSIQDQLDMQYWDVVNGTNVWRETIEAIKLKYPKQ